MWQAALAFFASIGPYLAQTVKTVGAFFAGTAWQELAAVAKAERARADALQARNIIAAANTKLSDAAVLAELRADSKKRGYE